MTKFFEMFAFLLFAMFMQKPAGAAEISPSKALHSKFIFPLDIGDKEPLSTGCEKPGAKALNPLLIDFAVKSAGRIASGIMDKIAEKTKAEAISLQSVISMEGFYTANAVAADGGCFVFHNGEPRTGAGSSVLGAFQLQMSEDRTAFRFVVRKWEFKEFIKKSSSNWFQSANRKDWVLRIEFLLPSSEALGNRTAFIEYVLNDIQATDISKLLDIGQSTPWLTAPTRPQKMTEGRNLPLNVKTTLLETSRPNQIAQWLGEYSKTSKTTVVDAVESAVRMQIDKTAAAEQSIKLNSAASDAYSAYKTAWDTCYASLKNRPAAPVENANDSANSKYEADSLAWSAGFSACTTLVGSKRDLARAAYDSAEIGWSGDLPEIDEDS